MSDREIRGLGLAGLAEALAQLTPEELERVLPPEAAEALRLGREVGEGLPNAQAVARRDPLVWVSSDEGGCLEVTEVQVTIRSVIRVGGDGAEPEWVTCQAAAPNGVARCHRELGHPGKHQDLYWSWWGPSLRDEAMTGR